MLDALSYILLMLLIRKRRSRVSYRMEVVWFHIRLVDSLQERIQFCLTSRTFCITQRNQFHRIVVMIENDDVLIHDIIDIRRIILLHRRILYRDILKVAYGIESGETIESTEVLALSLHMESLDKVIDCLGDGEFALLSLSLTEGREFLFFHLSIGISGCHDTMSHSDACHRMYADEGTRVL